MESSIRAQIGIHSMEKPFTAIDGFCGAGGLSLGLKRAGFDIRAAFDINERAVESYRSNIGPEGFVADAKVLSAAELIDRAELSDRLDLMAAGPPCQGFSRQKRGAHLGDDRNNLVVVYAQLIHDIQPKFFILENVDQLGGKRGRTFIEVIQALLQEYILYPSLYNSADFGLAQTRARFVIVGKHRDVCAGFRLPCPTVDHWTTVGEVLAGLPEPPEDYSEHPLYANHYRARVTTKNIERFSHVPQGGGWQDIPFHLRLKCHQEVDVRSGGWPDVYGRLRSQGQAPTITGGFDSFTRGRYGHPIFHRPLTPREAARLQGFPDEFRFYGTRHDVRHQIGNSVPPPLAEAIGQAISSSLNGESVYDLPQRGQISLDLIREKSVQMRAE